jgi:hypothetical protein
MGPHIILIKDTKGNIFGAFIANTWKNNKKIRCSQETFIFSFQKSKFITSYLPFDNSTYQYCSPEGIIIGLDQ